MKIKNKLKKYTALFAVIALLLSNAMLVSAATVVVEYSVQAVLPSAEKTGDNLMLTKVMTFNGGKSYVGLFKDNNYEYFYGTSSNLADWNIKSGNFSVVYGNGMVAGVSYINYPDTQIVYTTDGETWLQAGLPNGLKPERIKFESGWFNVKASEDHTRTHLLFTRDFITWIDITDDLATINADVYNAFVCNDKICAYNYDFNADKTTVYWANMPYANMPINWQKVNMPNGGNYYCNFYYEDASNICMSCYSVSGQMYYGTSDLVNWTRKEWNVSQEDCEYYTYTSTEKFDTDASKYVQTSVYPGDYRRTMNETDQGQVISVTYNGVDWTNHEINIYLDGNLVSKKSNILENYVIENGVVFNKDKNVLVSYPAASNAKEYKVPGSVKEIYAEAFSYSKNLENVIMHNGITTIGEEAFYDCRNLKSVTIPKRVTTVEEDTFCGCMNLESVIIPRSVTTIKSFAFTTYGYRDYTVYYEGTYDEWNAINIEGWNGDLQEADKIFNYAIVQNAPIVLPSFAVNLNGISFDSANAKYPLIMYNDITYFPMTYFDSRLLGLETTYSLEEGLGVAPLTGDSVEYQHEKATVPNATYDNATVASGKITVNGKPIDNESEEYPLLLYRDVTYFPLTWRFAVEEFGWEYHFDMASGLKITNSKVKYYG